MKSGRLPRKVLHVMNGAAGGAALSTIGLIEGLRTRGIESAAVCLDAGSKEEKQALLEATKGEATFTALYTWNKKVRVELWKRPLLEASQIVSTQAGRGSAARVIAAALARRADLIHTNTILTPEGGIAARWLRLPHVWHLRELLGKGRPFRLPVEGRRFGRYLLGHCSMLVANSNASASVVKGWMNPRLLSVVPNGIDLSRFERTTPRTQKTPIVVAMIGNLTSELKKHELFIRAAALVRAEGVEFRIYGHGGTPYAEKMKRLAVELGLEARFRWPGYVADQAELMREIDVLAHPLNSESFGRIIVEAMAARLPVVGVKDGGVGEIVEEGVTGFLARPDDPLDMARAIEQLVRDPEQRKRCGEAGRLRAEEHYSIEACVAGLAEVYRVAMDRPLSIMPAVLRWPLRNPVTGC